MRSTGLAFSVMNDRLYLFWIGSDKSSGKSVYYGEVNTEKNTIDTSTAIQAPAWSVPTGVGVGSRVAYQFVFVSDDKKSVWGSCDCGTFEFHSWVNLTGMSVTRILETRLLRQCFLPAPLTTVTCLGRRMLLGGMNITEPL